MWDRFFEDEDWRLPVLSKAAFRHPATDVYETDKEVVAEVNLPGVDPKDIDVSVEDPILYISSREEEKKEERGKDYWRKEIRRGSFERAVRLPSAVDEKSVDAVYEKGVLKVTLKKTGAKGKSAKKVNIKIK